MAKKAEEKKIKDPEKVKKGKPAKAAITKDPITKGTPARAKKTKTEPKVSPSPEIIQSIPAQNPVLSIRERLIKRVNLPQPVVESQPPKTTKKSNKVSEAPSAQNVHPKKKGQPTTTKEKSDDLAAVITKPNTKPVNKSKKVKPQSKPVIDNTIMTRGLSEKEISAMAVRSKPPVLKLKEANQSLQAAVSEKKGKKGKGKENQFKLDSEINTTAKNLLTKKNEEIDPLTPPLSNISGQDQDRKKAKRRDKWNKRNKSLPSQGQTSPEEDLTVDVSPVSEEPGPDNRKKIAKTQSKPEQPVISEEISEGQKQNIDPSLPKAKSAKSSKKKAKPVSSSSAENIAEEDKSVLEDEKIPDIRKKIIKRPAPEPTTISEEIPEDHEQKTDQSLPKGKPAKSSKKKAKPVSSSSAENIAEEDKSVVEDEKIPEIWKKITLRPAPEPTTISEEIPEDQEQKIDQSLPKGKPAKSSKKKAKQVSSTPAENIAEEDKSEVEDEKIPDIRKKITLRQAPEPTTISEEIPEDHEQKTDQSLPKGKPAKSSKKKAKQVSSKPAENIAEEDKSEVEDEKIPDIRKKITLRPAPEPTTISEEIPENENQEIKQANSQDKRNKNKSKKKPQQEQSKSIEQTPDEKKQDTGIQSNKNIKKGKKAQDITAVVEKPKKKEVKKPRKKYKALLSKAEKQNKYITNFLARLEKKLINDLFLDKESTILLAVSGGVDSIVLLDAMRILAEKNDFYIVVAHYNHNLRGKSADTDEAFTGGIARKYELEFSSAKGNVKKYAQKKSLSLEHAARVLRYQFLERTARNFHCEFIATAHTSDDSAETFLLNLIRGAGLTGLSGIQSKRPLGKNVILVRPLIDFRKDELIEYAKQRKLEWHEDESNYLLNYTRNRIRHELLPMMRQFNPSISDVINRSAELFRGADEFIANHVKIAIEYVVFDKKPDRISLKIPLLETFNVFLQGELIKLALDKHFQVPGASLSMIDRIISLMNSETGTIYEISNELMAFKDRDIIIISRKSIFTEVNESIIRTGNFKFGDYTLKLEEVSKSDVLITDDKSTEYFDLELVPSILSVRNWKDGDTFIPLGMKGTMKVSDFLTNNKVSLIDKPDILLLCSKSDIVWVLGHRINDKFKITDSTQRFLRAEIINKRKKDEPA